MMNNGMTAPEDFWKMSAKGRDKFTMLATWINFLNPSIIEEELLGITSPSGGGSS